MIFAWKETSKVSKLTTLDFDIFKSVIFKKKKKSKQHMNLAISGEKKYSLLNFDFDSLERGIMEVDKTFSSKAVLDSTTRVQPIDY